MYGCNQSRLHCQHWKPNANNVSQAEVSPSGDRLYLKPFYECKIELQAIIPTPETEEEAKEIVSQCMEKKGWDFVEIYGSR